MNKRLRRIWKYYDTNNLFFINITDVSKYNNHFESLKDKNEQLLSSKNENKNSKKDIIDKFISKERIYFLFFI